MPPRGRKPAKAAVVEEEPEIEPGSDDDEEEQDDEEELDELDGTDEKAAATSAKYEVVVDPATVAAQRPSTVYEYQTPNDRRITSDCLNYPEFVNLIGMRTTHIAAGAVPYVNIDGMTDPREMALKEMQEGKCPFLIKRYITTSHTGKIIFELWDPNKMIINDLFYKK